MLGGSKADSAKKRAPVRNESLREDPTDGKKRVARRRLIGSIALLLLAIIVLPLVLEDAPKPVSGDIALHIPSRDLAVRSNPDAAPPSGASDTASDGKTVDAKSSDVKATGKTDARAEPKADNKSDPRLDSRIDATKPELRADSSPDAKLETKLETKVEPKVDGKSAVKPEVKAEVKPEAKSPAKSEAKTDTKVAEPKAGRQLPVVQSDDPIASFANAKPQSASNGSGPAASATNTAGGPAGRSNHWVQIGAFGNEAKAREMASQLRGKGYPAVTEVVRGSGSGELYRVRVGPLETRESASRARDNLAKAGFDGSVVQ